MKIITGARASTVLYNWLLSNKIKTSVLIPCNICESVPASYMKAGCEVSFCDISKTDWGIDLSVVKSIIKDKNIGILHYNHTYGRVSEKDSEFLTEIKKTYPNIVIVDDRCLSIPSLTNNDNCSLTIYSTGYSKYLSINEGGYGCMSDKYNYANHLQNYIPECEKIFEKHIKACHTTHTPIDTNIMLSDWMPFEFNDVNYFERIYIQKEKTDIHKKMINDIYSVIPGALPKEYNNWRYNLLLENATECKKALFEHGLFCSNHYMSLGNGYFSPQKTPNADYLERHIVNLFNDFCYTREQAEKTAELLRKKAIPAEIKL